MLSIAEKEQKVLWRIFLTVISISLPIALNYLSSDNKLLKYLSYIVLFIWGIVVIYLLFSGFIKYYKTRNTFRHLLTVTDKKKLLTII